MADQPKPPADQPAPPPADAPKSQDAAKPADAPTPAGGPQPEPLADGTTPTVLAPGDNSLKPIEPPKGAKAGLGSVYRRADITTTLITFGVGVAVAGLILAGYLFIIHPKQKAANAPKVTTLSQDDLAKLGAFFGGNAAGQTGEVLTFNSPTFFKSRIAVSSDLKVGGGVSVDGTTALGDLTVDKTSTLGVTNIRGQLTVAGPITLQSPAIFSAGLSVTGNAAVSGNGSFGGSISAGIINTTSLSVSGTINLAGHFTTTSTGTPGVSAAAGATAPTIEGNDDAGTVGFSAGTGPGQYLTVTYRQGYSKQPHVIITPANQCSGNMQFYVISTGNFFVIGSDGTMSPDGTISLPNHPTPTGCGSPASYLFNYWVVQ